MFISIGKIILVFVCMFPALTSCVSYSTKLEYDVMPDTNKAYIYGNFKMSEFNMLGASIFIREITKGIDYIIKFDCNGNKFNEESVSVIAVEPGTYKITKFAFSKGDDFIGKHYLRLYSAHDWEISSIKNGNEFCKKLKNGFQARAGYAYYIGDYTAKSNYKGNAWYITGITKIGDNFTKTTSDFKKKFSTLNDVAVIHAFDM